MNSTLYNGVSGIKTHQFGLDSVSNNIANINTTGYRANVPEFKSLFANVLTTTNPASSVKSDMNYGATKSSNAISNVSGNYIESEGELNIAYAGKGWFVVGDNENIAFNVEEPNADAFFTRDGSFSRDAEGYIVNAAGYYMLGVDLGKIHDGIFISDTTNDTERLSVGEIKPLRIPQDLHYGPTETTRVNVAINLNPNQSALPVYETLATDDGSLDEARILALDVNSLLIDSDAINAPAYNDINIVVNQRGERREYNFTYGTDFRTLGELINLINDSTNLNITLSRNPDGSVSKNLALEVSNPSLSAMEVTLGGKLFTRLGLTGERELNNLKLESFNPAKHYQINDLVNLNGAIFRKIAENPADSTESTAENATDSANPNRANNANPLEDSASWILVDSTGVGHYDAQGAYNINDLVNLDGVIYQKLSDSTEIAPNDDNENWREIGEVVASEIAPFTDGEAYARNSIVSYNNHIYLKIGDENNGNPADDTMNWKILNSERYLSQKLNVANYKTTTEFFDENGEKMLVISQFILRDNTTNNRVWSVKSAIYDKDGETMISPEITHEIAFDSEGKVSAGEPITLEAGERSIAYSVLGSDNKPTSELTYMDSAILETSRDGTQKGELVSIGVDSNGVINLSFSNGITEPMGRVGIVAFVNDQGLQKVGGNLFQMSAMSVDGGESTIASGAPILGWDENAQLRFGQVLHKYLETSNVNAADAMTDLIVFQRGYAMNAKAFTTGDDLIREAINLKR